MNNIILANGEFPVNPRLLQYLRDAGTLICCDGAVNKLLAAGFAAPAWIVGDLDSVSPEIRKKYAARLIHYEEQETNDLNKAARFCLERNIVPDAILGASGGREDHLLGNLSRFAAISVNFPQLKLYTDTGCFYAVRGHGAFTMPVGTQFSLFSFEPRQILNVCGAKYPIENMTLPFWHCATLNEAAAPEIIVDASGNFPVLLYVQCF